ncbi:MAG: acetylornithine/succinylornithine family transaminase [Ignavibacteriaceae bacterium]|nr:acetylornithine/succinylornithine family transaminase [Ignavibacteriaceae bacterium]
MNSNIFEQEKKLFLPTYNRIPLEISHGKGVYLYDKNGNKYLDFFAGLAVNALGYAHPKIVEAISGQIAKFGHISNSFITDVQVELAELLIKYSGMSKVFFSNSGTEAVEAALKIIRKKEGPDKKIFSLTNSFHGRTYGAMSLTARSKYKKGFEPLVPNIYQINFNDVSDLESKIDETTAAVFLEFIQGEGGVNVVSDEFASKLFELRDKYHFAVAADEIQVGIGRTGKPFAFNHFNVKPDLIVAAKAIGGGLPLGALLTSPEFDNVFETGKHGTTFGGNPVSCAGGNVVLHEVFENGVLENVAELGKYFIDELEKLSVKFPEDIKDVRGKGFIIGVELFYPGQIIVQKMLEKKILINCTNQNVLRILPPLIITKDEIDYFLFNLEQTLQTK